MTIRCDEISYEILGGDLQAVEAELDPGETVIGEAGAMVYVDDGVTFKARMGDGSEADRGVLGKMISALKRKIVQESTFLTHFTNNTREIKKVAFASDIPGKIIPIDLKDVNGEIIAQKSAFLCAAKGTRINIAFAKKLMAGIFGGEGYVLQSLSGDGMVFLNAGGTIIEKHLQGETLLVETGSLVAFENTIEYDVRRSGSLATMLWGGEGVFLSSLSGFGRVWVQSLPFSKLAEHIHSLAPPPITQDDGK